MKKVSRLTESQIDKLAKTLSRKVSEEYEEENNENVETIDFYDFVDCLDRLGWVSIGEQQVKLKDGRSAYRYRIDRRRGNVPFEYVVDEVKDCANIPDNILSNVTHYKQAPEIKVYLIYIIPE